MITTRTIRLLWLALAPLSAWGSEAARACPAAPVPVRDIAIPRYYADASGTEVDPALKASYDAAVEPLVTFVRGVVRSADQALKTGRADKRQDEARCALAWLEAWARGGGYLGQKVSQQGEYQRKWDMTGLALAYLKVKPQATSQQQAVIEAWLVRLAQASRRFFDNPERKRNNHWYWLGLGLGAVAVATDDASVWAEARRIASDAARDIRPDGALDMELARGPRALHYHAFSAMPLVVLAEIAARRGEDFYSFERGALHRLVALTSEGLQDPARFARLAGGEQTVSPSTPGAGWYALYARRFPVRARAYSPATRSADRRLGGDVDTLMTALERRKAPLPATAVR